MHQPAGNRGSMYISVTYILKLNISSSFYVVTMFVLIVWLGSGTETTWLRFRKSSFFWLKIPVFVDTNKAGDVTRRP